MKISLLPGWGLGVAPLQSLADSLSHFGGCHVCAKGLAPEKAHTTCRGASPLLQTAHATRGQAPFYKSFLLKEYEVQLLPLPECTTLEQALDQLDTQIPSDSWLIGWSLGGMLATALAHRRGNSCPGLITLASNACFVARDGWPHAMPQLEFNNFSRRVARNWAATLKGFQQLCLHGSQQESVPVELADTVSTDAEARAASLSWLSQLDNRTAIAELQCRQLHVLAEKDALVPLSVAQDLQQLSPQAQVHIWPGSHAFVLEDHSELAARVHAFISRRCGK